MSMRDLDKYIPFTVNKLGRKILTISVDLDGTLCEGEYWGAEELEPIRPMIDKINRLAKSHFIVIHTARRREWAENTINWLHRHGVRYHSIAFDKMPADVYIDDKCVNPFTNLNNN